MKPAPSGDALREIRLALGMSRSEFADRLNTALRTYEGWENGRRPQSCLVIAIAHVQQHPEGLPDA